MNVKTLLIPFIHQVYIYIKYIPCIKYISFLYLMFTYVYMFILLCQVHVYTALNKHLELLL